MPSSWWPSSMPSSSTTAWSSTRQMSEEAWSGIDVQLKRRADLVPNLIETVKGYAAHERGVFDEVTEARTRAQSVPAGDVEARAKAEGALSLGLGRLFAVAENYPELKANANFLDLQQQLSGLENDIQMARRYYNGAVRQPEHDGAVLPVATSSPTSSASRSGTISRSRSRATAPCRRSRSRPERTKMIGAMVGSTSPLRRGRKRQAERSRFREAGATPGWLPPSRDLLRLWPTSLDPFSGRFSAVFASLRLLALLAAVFAAASPAAAEEIIESFQSDVTVARDATLTVVETIRVNAERNQIRHGIYRDFPLTFQDANGSVHEVGFKLLDVTRDGREEPHFTQRLGEWMRIYAGDKDVFVDPGSHTYVFTYETDRQIRWFDGKPELYWNVTGNAWTFPIAVALGRVTLPGGAAPVRWTAYTGPLRRARHRFRRRRHRRRARRPDHAKACAARRPDASSKRSRLTPWCRRARRRISRYFLRDNRGWIIGIVGFIGVFGYYAAAWNAVGRDPKAGTIIPLFHRAGRRVAGACKLYPALGIRRQRLARVHRRRAQSRRPRALDLRLNGRRASSPWNAPRRSLPAARPRFPRASRRFSTGSRRGEGAPRSTARTRPRCRASAKNSARASRRRAATSSSAATPPISSADLH